MTAHGYRFARTWAHHLAIVLTPETHAALMAMQQPGQPRALARRARVICLLAKGVPYAEVQRQTGMTMNHIFKWVRRYAHEGIQGLQHRNKARPRVRRPSFRVQDGDRAELERWSRLTDAPRLAVRAQAVLWRTEGVSGAPLPHAGHPRALADGPAVTALGSPHGALRRPPHTAGPHHVGPRCCLPVGTA
jgi:transposase